MYDYFTKHNLNWGQVGSICTDGAPAMVGSQSEFVTLVKEKCPDVVFTHCVLHRHAVATKTLPANLEGVMDAVFAAVKFIRSHALNHRLFQQRCEEMGSEHTHILYHTEVRWLSRGKALKRALGLLDEIQDFLRSKSHALTNFFANPIFTSRIAYMCDIYTHMNELNVNLQCKGVTIIEAILWVL